MDKNGRISGSNALRLLFKLRADAAAKKGAKNNIYAKIYESLCHNGGPTSTPEAR